MTKQDLKQIQDSVKNAVNPINEKLTKMQKALDNHGKKIGMIWKHTVYLTETTAEIQETLDSHTDALKSHTSSLKRIEEKVEHNANNINRLEKRIKPVEDRMGIMPPPEFNVI